MEKEYETVGCSHRGAWLMLIDHERNNTEHQDERSREDERRGGGAETRSAARLHRLSEEFHIWLRSCLAVP